MFATFVGGCGEGVRQFGECFQMFKTPQTYKKLINNAYQPIEIYAQTSIVVVLVLVKLFFPFVGHHFLGCGSYDPGMGQDCSAMSPLPSSTNQRPQFKQQTLVFVSPTVVENMFSRLSHVLRFEHPSSFFCGVAATCQASSQLYTNIAERSDNKLPCRGDVAMRCHTLLLAGCRMHLRQAVTQTPPQYGPFKGYTRIMGCLVIFAHTIQGSKTLVFSFSLGSWRVQGRSERLIGSMSIYLGTYRCPQSRVMTKNPPGDLFP